MNATTCDRCGFEHGSFPCFDPASATVTPDLIRGLASSSSTTTPDFAPVAAPFGSGEATTAQDYVPVRAMEAMLAIRHEQIHRYGHTLEADRQRPVRDFAQDLESLARAIVEDAQFHKHATRIRTRALKLGALCMALADRLEGED